MALDTEQDYLTGTQKTDIAFRRNVRQIVDRMIEAYNKGLNGIFNNQEGLTAQQAADALGTDAEDMFKFLNELRTTIQTYTGRSLTPASDYGTVTFPGDGTAVITLN